MVQDSLTSAQAVMTTDHAYIHDKLGFSVNFDTGSLAAAASYKVSLTTPSKLSRKAIHLRPTLFSATANLMELAIYKDSTATGGTVNVLRNHYDEEYPKISDSTFKVGVTAALTGKLLMASTAGGNFGNQPAGDAVDIVSDEILDNFQTVTIYGTITGATTTVTSEVLTLNGTTAVTSSITTWQNILGVEMSAASAGTITISENSGSAEITTITALGALSSGVATITDSNARDTVLRHDANGASTKVIGIVGTAPDGTALSSVDALNGATEEAHNTDIFRTVTKILIGDVESARECWILRPEVKLSSFSAGSGGNSTKSGGSTGADDEYVLQPETTYVFAFTNIGTVTASTGYVSLFFYEEEM